MLFLWPPPGRTGVSLPLMYGGGGDATTLHNGVRDVYFDFCERAGLRPISEAQTFFWMSSPLTVAAGLPTSFASQPWLSPVSCPMEPGRHARSQFAWTLRSSMLWARITGDTQRSERGPPRMSTALRKLPRNDISNKCWAAGYRF